MKVFEIHFTTGKTLTVTVDYKSTDIFYGNPKSRATGKAIELGLMTKDDCFDISDIIEIEQPKLEQD